MLILTDICIENMLTVLNKNNALPTKFSNNWSSFQWFKNVGANQMSFDYTLEESLKSTDTKYMAGFCTKFWKCFICKCPLVSRSKFLFLNVVQGLGLH